MKKQKFKNMGGNIPVRNFLGGSFRGEFTRESLIRGNFTGGDFLGGSFPDTDDYTDL